MPVSWVRRWLFVAAIAVVSLSCGSPVRADSVKVRAAAHDGYGRIVFNWPAPVVYSTTSEGGLLVVRFGRPIDTSYAGVLKGLGAYIRDATPATDGRSVTFALRGQYDVRSFDIGAAVVVDIMKATDGAAATPPARKKGKPATEAGAGPSVAVRTGVHEGYTRVVFDWPKKVNYSISRQGGKTMLSFDRPARIDLKPLQNRTPKFIAGASREDTPDGVAVVLQVPETSRIRNFRSGPKVVIDVLAPSSDPAVAEKKSGPARETAPVDQAQQPKKLAPLPVKTEKPVVAGRAAKPVGKPEDAGKPISLNPAKPLTSTPLTPLESAAARDKTGVLDKKDEAVLTHLAGVKIIDPTAGPAGAGGGLATNGNAVGIRIDWDEPVAAAVFRRVGYLWIVFDKAAHMDVDALRIAGGNIIRTIEQIPDNRATLLRLTTLPGVNPSLKRDGLAWILEFRQQPLQPTSAIDVTPQPHSPIGARLFMSVTEPSEGIVVTDPAVGDNLIVVPIIPLGYGIAGGRIYPQVQILASSQGIVLRPRTDALRVRSLRQGVEITNAGGLQLSDVSPAQAAESKLDGTSSIRSYSRLFDLRKWRQADAGTFNDKKQELERAAAEASIGQREQARMDLARFYLANDYGPEALGVLSAVARDNPKIAETPEFLGIRGAANTITRRFAEAHADLDNSALDHNDEGLFWRAVLRAYEGDLAGAAADLRRTGGVLRIYPKPLKIPLGILVSEAAMELGDVREATLYLESMRASDPNPAQSSEMDFIDGRLLELGGDSDAAVAKWEKVLEGPHRPSRAKAAIARTELLLKLGQIDRIEAIKELEDLRFAWRGDKLEFNLLRRLGELYLKVGDYRNGLRTLRQAATHFRDDKKAPEITEEMTKAFTGLYLNNEADSLQPITAIALYDEFKELTPPGELGDEMIRKLADRLVDVDLLDRAAALLQAQVEFRLKGLEKARVGTQLALVHILAREYDQGIAALDESNIKDLPEDLVVQRRHLRARALMGLQQVEDALTLLKDDQSHDAELLRTEIYWNDKNWGRAAKSLRKLVKSTGAKPHKPVDDKQGEYVLNLAVAMTLSGDEQGIARMRADYGAAMDETSYRDAFRLIASTDNLGLINYSAIASKVTDVENFKSFMTAYQERLKERKLSAIN